MILPESILSMMVAERWFHNKALFLYLFFFYRILLKSFLFSPIHFFISIDLYLHVLFSEFCYYHYSGAQVVPDFATGSPFKLACDMSPWYFKHWLIFWHNKMFQAYLALFLSQPWHQAFLRESLIPSETWDIEIKVGYLIRTVKICGIWATTHSLSHPPVDRCTILCGAAENTGFPLVPSSLAKTTVHRKRGKSPAFLISFSSWLQKLFSWKVWLKGGGSPSPM